MVTGFATGALAAEMNTRCPPYDHQMYVRTTENSRPDLASVTVNMSVRRPSSGRRQQAVRGGVVRGAHEVSGDHGVERRRARRRDAGFDQAARSVVSPYVTSHPEHGETAATQDAARHLQRGHVRDVGTIAAPDLLGVCAIRPGSSGQGDRGTDRRRFLRPCGWSQRRVRLPVTSKSSRLLPRGRCAPLDATHTPPSLEAVNGVQSRTGAWVSRRGPSISART